MAEMRLPVILDNSSGLKTADKSEVALLSKARKVLDAGFPDHSLLDLWNASIHNLRRRTELYGIDMFLSAVKDSAGRKRYDSAEETLEDRWSGVDDVVLIEGASVIGVLTGKAAKALEMINWVRNHSSSAHLSNESVTATDVLGLALILQENLFNQELPEAGHSPAGLFDPVKKGLLDPDSIQLLIDQIESFNSRDIRTVFGFFLDYICGGEEPAYTNIMQLFETVWRKAPEESRILAGARYHGFLVDAASDDSSDKQAKTRLLEALISVDGIKYIPDAARALIFRKAAQALAKAKDTSYGWVAEEREALSIAQFGACVPRIAFEDVYQEILAVWCGNYWGRSTAHVTLRPFIEVLNTQQIVLVAWMFTKNERVRDELSQTRPKMEAVRLLQYLRTKLTIQAHINDVDQAIDSVEKL